MEYFLISIKYIWVKLFINEVNFYEDWWWWVSYQMGCKIRALFEKIDKIREIKFYISFINIYWFKCLIFNNMTFIVYISILFYSNLLN